MKKIIACSLTTLLAITILAEETTNVDYGQATQSPTLDLIWKFERESSGGVTYAVITGVAVSGGENPTGDITVPLSLVCSDNTPLVVKKIADGAFANQIGISSISIPATIETVGAGMFTGCTILSQISVDENNPWLASSAGALYDKDRTRILACPPRIETIQLPATLKEIAPLAFASCHRLAALTVPDAVEAIGTQAFLDCARLTSVSFEGNAPAADASIVDGANVNLCFYKKPGTTGWDAAPWNGFNVVESAAEQPSGIVSDKAGNVTWFYRVINGEAEIYNGGFAAIPTSTSETYTYDPATFEWISDGRLVIPTSLGGYPVTRIGDYAFIGCSGISNIEIPKTIRRIGDYAFANCSSLGSVTLPTGIKEIGYRPFAGASITTLALPDSLRSLTGNPLAGCDTLLTVSISLDNSYYTVVNGILYDKDVRSLVGCPARKESASIATTAERIGPEAFDGCFRLRTILLPDYLTSVGASAFRDATRLSSLVFPASLSALEGPGIFEGCSRLGFVGFTGNAPTVDPQLFAGAPAALIVYVAQGTTGWKDATTALPDSGKWPSDDGYGRAISNLDVSAEAELKEGDIFVGITTNGTTRYTYTLEVLANKGVKILGISPKPVGGFEVPSAFDSSLGTLTVKTLGDNLFANSIGLLSVSIPNSVTAIGDEIFKDCNVLASVTLAHGLRSIGRHPFEGTAIETIALPDTVSSIDGNIFFGCDPSVSLSVGDNNPYFAESAEGALYDKDFTTLFAVPMTAEELTVPAATTNIDDEAFANCIRLKAIAFLGNAPTAADDILADTSTTLEITVEEGSLGWDGDPTSSALPASGLWRDRAITVNAEPPVVDSNTDGIWKWTVNAGVATLYNGGSSALLDTNYNGAVSVPAEVTDSATGNKYTVVALGDRAMYGCKYVTAVTLPTTIESIGAEPFSGTKITSLSIPEYVADIGGNPAAGCSRFTGFTVDAANIDFSADAAGFLYDAAGATLLAIPARATEIYVPASVTAIAADAFAGCTTLSKVNFIGNAPTAADTIFADTPATMTSYAQASASGFTGDTWKGRPLVITGGAIGPTDRETIGGLTWYYRVVDGVAEIWRDGRTAVESDSPITTIDLPATLGGYQVKGIGNGALANQRGITSISIPDTYEWIGDNAFSNCTSLASIDIPYGVRYIGRQPFVNTIIREIKLPDSVIDVGGNIAAGTLFTTTINIEDSSHFVYSDDGVLYNKDQTKLYACPARAEGTVTIPNTVTNIAADAFFGCFRLTYLNLPKTVNTIGSGAFNVSGIWPGLSAPESTPKLLSVFYNGDVPNAQDDIYDGAPTELVSYVFTDGWGASWKGRPVVLIDSAKPPILSLKDDDGITWYYRIVDGTVEIYNEDADGNAIAAISPKSTSGVRYYVDKDATDYRMALRIPNSINGYAVTRIGNHALDGCKALTYIGIPASVEEIGDSAFKDCTAVRSIAFIDGFPFNATDGQIVLPGGIMTLGYHPFEGMKASYLSIPYTVTEMDGNPLAGMDFVREVEVVTANTRFYSSGNIVYDKRRTKVIGVPANYDGSSLSFLNTVKEIGPEALQGCDNLDTISLPDSLESISSNAFAGCSGIATLTIPATVTEIGSAAFSNCTSLAKVTYSGDAPTAPDDLYAGTPEALTSYASSEAEGFTEPTWKGRAIKLDEDPYGQPLTYTDTFGIVWEYQVVEDGIAEIVSVSSENAITALTFPTTIGALTVKGVGNGAIANQRGITGVSIPATYEWIGDGAFSNCTSLASVTLGNSLRTIGRHPFDRTNVGEVSIPASVSSIDGNVLYGCSPAATVSVASGNQRFALSDDGALYDKGFKTLYAVPMSSETLTVPETTTTINDDAFADCMALANVKFLGNAPAAADGILADTPATLVITVLDGSLGWDGDPASSALPASGLWRNRKIEQAAGEAAKYTDSSGTEWDITVYGNKAELGANGATPVIPASTSGEVTVPGEITIDGKTRAITAIPDGAFDGCSEITAINIPASITSIAADAFNGCTSLESFSVDSKNPAYSSRSGILYSKDGKTLVKVPAKTSFAATFTEKENTTKKDIVEIIGSTNPDTMTTAPNLIIERRSYGKVNSTTVTEFTPSVSAAAILSGVTAISDYAFTDCGLLPAGSTVSGTLIVKKDGKETTRKTGTFTLPVGTDSTGWEGSTNISSQAGFYNGSVCLYHTALTGGITITKEVPFTIPATVTSCGDLAFEGSHFTAVNKAKLLGVSSSTGANRIALSRIAGDGNASYGPFTPGVPISLLFEDFAGFSARGVPAGLRWTARTGVIEGTPGNPGTYTVTFSRRVNANGKYTTETKTVNIRIAEFPVIGIKASVLDAAEGRLAVADDQTVEAYVGVEMSMPIDTSNELDGSPSSVSAQGLPAGLRLVKTPVKNDKNVIVRYLYSIEGIPSRAQAAKKVTLNISNRKKWKGSTSFAIKVLSLPNWSVGNYNGICHDNAGDPIGAATAGISAAGRLSAKVMVPSDDGKRAANLTCTASGFKHYDAESGTLSGVAKMRIGKKNLDVPFTLTESKNDGTGSLSFSFKDKSASLVQNIWNRKDLDPPAYKVNATTEVGGLMFKLAANGKVIWSGRIEGDNGRLVSVSGTCLLLNGPTALVYIPPRSNLVGGRCELVELWQSE